MPLDGPAVPGHVATRFASLSSVAPRVFRVPGRVNLIGEHTDYNDGLVMPAAIDRFLWVAAWTRDDHRLAIQSFDAPGGRTSDLRQPLTPAGDWTDYAVGVAWALADAGFPVPGATIAIQSEIPQGAGLSSSAALEVGIAAALLDAAAIALDLMTIADICRHAENAFVGARCGVMDQFAVTHGRRGHCLRLDCRSREYIPIQIPETLRLVICNTMAKHEHASGGYNRRREECDEALRRLRSLIPGLASLRDVDSQALAAAGAALSPVLGRRVRHVVSENDRVERAAAALAAADLESVAACMAASHASLRDDYEVTTPELDLMVALALDQPGVHGARMTGGGFGGSTVNLVAATAAAPFADRVSDAYRGATGIQPDILICEPAEGVQACGGLR